MNPKRIWLLSCKLHRRGLKPLAKLLKLVNFVLFKAILPFEAEIQPDIDIRHYGLGVVIHPNVTIGHRVRLWHGVTLAAHVRPRSPHRLHIGDDVMIGAGATIIGRFEQNTYIGDGAQIGAGAVVTGDVPAGATMVGVPARPLPPKKKAEAAESGEVAESQETTACPTCGRLNEPSPTRTPSNGSHA